MWDLIFQKERFNLIEFQRVQSHIMMFRSDPTVSKVWEKNRNRYVDSHITVFAFFIVWCGVLKQHANRYVDLENNDSNESMCFVYETEIAVGIKSS